MASRLEDAGLIRADPRGRQWINPNTGEIMSERKARQDYVYGGVSKEKYASERRSQGIPSHLQDYREAAREAVAHYNYTREPDEPTLTFRELVKDERWQEYREFMKDFKKKDRSERTRDDWIAYEDWQDEWFGDDIDDWEDT